jgi:hypothetical protein
MSTWAPKPPGSTEFFPLDLIRQLAPGDSIVSCACQISVINGDDPDAAAMLVDEVEINGTLVAQKVQGGIYGCRYQLGFTANTLFGEVLKHGGDFYVGRTEPGNRDLTTLDAVKAWMDIKTDAADVLLQRLITSESRAIERAIQRPVLAQERTDFIQGYGSATIMPPATPIQSIERVLIDGVPVEVHHDNLTIWPKGGGAWPRNSRIQVTYTAGYDAVPYDLEQACIELVALHYKERDRIGHASKSVGGETMSYIIDAMPPSVISLINPYIKVAPC